MKKYIIDTNCLISFFTDRDIRQQEIIKKYFDQLSEYKCELYLTGHIISEFIYVLTKIYKIENNKTNTLIRNLLQIPGIIFLEGYYMDTILNIWPKNILNYGDAVIGAVSIKENIPILTFDKEFSKKLNIINVENIYLK
ncbi:MAG: PIN domain-containing protein [Spirochaetia bacterium]|nr:PIN domain-containing protein [Spirochaetia bacterium]